MARTISFYIDAALDAYNAGFTSAAVSLATCSSPAHMGSATREDVKVITDWIKAHG